MTQEEKAKAYDEALKRAIKHHDRDGLTLEQYETIDIIFPELKESKENKDERIRKALINVFATHKDYEMFFGVSVEDIRVWLEKQGEPNPYSGTSFEYNGHTWGMCARDNGVDILCDKHIIGHLDKQGEHNPANKVKPKFKVGDWIVFNGLTLYINEVVEGYYRTISKGDNIPNSYDWDIDNVARLWTIQDATWKPTKEQMKALHDINLTGDISYVGQGQTLIELYNDLKKLK